MTYSEKLKDPRWQKKRLKVMEYARWRCQICGNKDNTLHCHHSYYTRGKEPWQYPDGAIICICERCHEKIHGKEKQPPPATSFGPFSQFQPATDLETIPTPESAKAKFGALRAAVERIKSEEASATQVPKEDPKISALRRAVERVSGK